MHESVTAVSADALCVCPLWSLALGLKIMHLKSQVLTQNHFFGIGSARHICCTDAAGLHLHCFCHSEPGAHFAACLVLGVFDLLT